MSLDTALTIQEQETEQEKVIKHGNNGNGNGKSKNPRKGLCPDYETCKNYISQAYDCNIKRNLGINSISYKFPCYKEDLL